MTLGGGEINNPGRYLVLLPPINGATAISGTPYFTENPGDPFKAWDISATFDYMPSQYITFRLEYDHRAANVPYFSGPGGITPPGGNTGAPGSVVPGFTPDLRKTENRLDMAHCWSCSRKVRQRKLRTSAVRMYSVRVWRYARGDEMFEAVERRIREEALTISIVIACMIPMHAQQVETAGQSEGSVTVSAQTMDRLQQRLADLETEVSELKAQMTEMRSMAAAPATVTAAASGGPAHAIAGEGEAVSLANSGQAAPPESAVLSPEDRSILNYLKGTTINVSLDAYYAYNFNDPIGRVNLLRAYDVSSNAFSLNQAAVIFERAPDVDAGRRFGARLDLQFGQATATLQGNPVNEPRPAIYRNIFQAYGTYVIPVGSWPHGGFRQVGQLAGN